MKENVNRRGFLKKSAMASTAAAVGLSLEAAASRVRAAETPKSPPAGQSAAELMPTGKIGNLTISRLISGGNLIGGWAHDRDLLYVSDLMRHYNTDEKVLETLQLLEEHGVNTIIADPNERPYQLFPKYWRERGGKIQWIAEGHPKADDIKTDLQRSVDCGVSAIYVQGVKSDRLYKSGQSDLIGECVQFIKSQGLPAGIGAHMLEVIQKSEEAGYGADFYVKTLHSTNYWSARRPEQTEDVVDNKMDNYWAKTPEKTIEFMKTVEKPWIAFKVLAAGAIHPRDGFRYALENGADFLCVGMFDFQVREDAILARDLVAETKNRPRPWRG